MISKKKLAWSLGGGGTALALAAVALTANGTFAAWTAEAQTGTATIKAGALDAAALESMTWFDATSGTEKPVDLANHLVAPGDVLLGKQGINVELVGTNLTTAKVAITGGAATGDLATSFPSITYSVLDRDGKPVKVTENGTDVEIKDVPLGTAKNFNVAQAALGDGADLSVVIKAPFDPATTNQTNTGKDMTLSALKATITQG